MLKIFVSQPMNDYVYLNTLQSKTLKSNARALNVYTLITYFISFGLRPSLSFTDSILLII